MSKKTHQKQLARARAKRQTEQAVKTSHRNRIIGALAVLLLAVVVVGVALATRGDDADQLAIDDPDVVSTDDFAFGGEDEGNLANDVIVETDAEPQPSEAVTGTSAEPCGPAPDDAPTADESLSYDAPPPADYASGTVTVTVETTCGTFVMVLDADAAPQTVSSFAFLADEGFYTGVPFHRVKDQFVIQGGDPTGTGTGGPGYSFDDELALAEQVVAENGVYPRGTVAMANSGPDTNGSQFFVVQAEGGYSFPPNYAVFGEVTDGMDVVDRIAQGPVGGPSADLAVDPVRIIQVTTS